MKLSPDILYWKIKERLQTVTLQGRSSSKLALNRPEFYLDRNKVFEKNRVYVCSGDHLPQRPGILIFLGHAPMKPRGVNHQNMGALLLSPGRACLGPCQSGCTSCTGDIWEGRKKLLRLGH